MSLPQYATLDDLIDIYVERMNIDNKNMDRITSFWAWSIEKEYASKQYFNRLRQKDH